MRGRGQRSGAPAGFSAARPRLRSVRMVLTTSNACHQGGPFPSSEPPPLMVTFSSATPVSIEA